VFTVLAEMVGRTIFVGRTFVGDLADLQAARLRDTGHSKGAAGITFALVGLQTTHVPVRSGDTFLIFRAGRTVNALVHILADLAGRFMLDTAKTEFATGRVHALTFHQLTDVPVFKIDALKVGVTVFILSFNGALVGLDATITGRFRVTFKTGRTIGVQNAMTGIRTVAGNIFNCDIRIDRNDRVTGDISADNVTILYVGDHILPLNIQRMNGIGTGKIGHGNIAMNVRHNIIIHLRIAAAATCANIN
jgi:hypothetical protein